MFTYRGPAVCALSDGTSLPVSVNLTSEPGPIESLVGTATSLDFPPSYLNADEVTLRFPERAGAEVRGYRQGVMGPGAEVDV